MPPTAAQRRIHALLGVTSLWRRGRETVLFVLESHFLFNSIAIAIVVYSLEFDADEGGRLSP